MRDVLKWRDPLSTDFLLGHHFIQIFLRPPILRHTQIKKQWICRRFLSTRKTCEKKEPTSKLSLLEIFYLFIFFSKDEHWDASPSSNSRNWRFIVPPWLCEKPNSEALSSDCGTLAKSFVPGWLGFVGDEILPCYIGIRTKKVQKSRTGWWFHYISIFLSFFTRSFEKWSNLATFFQMGWFNHHLVL